MPEPDASRRRLLGAGLGLAAAACARRARATAMPPVAAPEPTAPPAPAVAAPAVAAPPASAVPTDGPGGPARFVQSGPGRARSVALTFHVAGEGALARPLFDQAARLGVPLTLFLVGTFVTANPAYVADLARAGHELGNHTATHPTMGRLTADQVAREIVTCRDELQRATGGPGTFFRPSGMDVASPLVLEQAASAGYATVAGFDVDPGDYQDPGAEAVEQRVRAGLHPGAIVSLHTAHPGTIAAFAGIVEGIRRAGLEPVTLRTLLGPP